MQFDSVDLKIESVEVDGKAARFSLDPKKLVVMLDHPANRGDRHEISIRYEGQPKKGLYFILPDRNYPHQPSEIWTQGEAEDTRYYIPLYDYPNDRTTSEMILTVPRTWITVSNGNLVGVKDDADGTKTWDWKQSEPLLDLSDFRRRRRIRRKGRYLARHHPCATSCRAARNPPSTPRFRARKAMLDLFSDKLGVPYPWAQYAQSSVERFRRRRHGKYQRHHAHHARPG